MSPIIRLSYHWMFPFQQAQLDESRLGIMCELWLLLVFTITIPAMQLSCEWMPQLALETFWQKHEKTRWRILLTFTAKYTMS